MGNSICLYSLMSLPLHTISTGHHLPTPSTVRIATLSNGEER